MHSRSLSIPISYAEQVSLYIPLPMPTPAYPLIYSSPLGPTYLSSFILSPSNPPQPCVIRLYDLCFPYWRFYSVFHRIFQISQWENLLISSSQTVEANDQLSSEFFSIHPVVIVQSVGPSDWLSVLNSQPFYTLGYQRATMCFLVAYKLRALKTFGDNLIRATTFCFPTFYSSSCAQKECNIATTIYIMSISCLPSSSRWASSPMKRLASRLFAGRSRSYLLSNCCYLLLYGASPLEAPLFSSMSWCNIHEIQV